MLVWRTLIAGKARERVTSTTLNAAKPSRLAYIDWMRGLACIFMFQTHCYDSWLSPEARHGRLIYWSQLGGTVPAAAFVYLGGFAFAFVTLRLRKKGLEENRNACEKILRVEPVLGLRF